MGVSAEDGERVKRNDSECGRVRDRKRRRVFKGREGQW